MVNEIQTEELEAETQDVTNECPYCAKPYKSVSALTKHMEKCDGNPKNATEPEKAPWIPEDCPTCGKTFKTELGFSKHVEAAKCKIAENLERVVLTEEEKKERLRAYVKKWVDKNQTIQIRLLRGGDDLAFVDSKVAELKEKDEAAGWATYFRELLAADKKKSIRKGDWEKVEEETSE